MKILAPKATDSSVDDTQINPREGWAEDARRLVEQGDDALVWPEFANADDGDRRTEIAAQQRASFIAEAKAADAQMCETGMGYDADEVHQYLFDKIAGRPTQEPQLKRWRKTDLP